MIDDFIKEIQELKDKCKQLESLKIDKKRMADKLLEYELKEYEQIPIQERKEKYFNETCIHCRRGCIGSSGLPDDIGKPIKNKADYFPAHKGCEDFMWD